MSLLHIITGLGILLTVISGQYSDHKILFWAFLVLNISSTLLYGNRHIIHRHTMGDSPTTLAAIVDGLIAILVLVSVVLFLVLMVVIWI
jgi:hypothetical protein